MKILSRKNYIFFIAAIFLLPNLFVMALGIESFPYTQAPMFGHYIDSNTKLYLLKFEGHTADGSVDLVDYYGKSELRFIRHFFSKVYGSSDYFTPFSGRVLEDEERFQERLTLFFDSYQKFLWEEYQLKFDSIEVKIAQVDNERNIVRDYRPF
ncbi:MAG: hypothetical protein VX772_06915, partial [Bacteroidota bacterium]|nr:hypothetical protein [Bacteroidota bacterium]